MKNLIIIGAGGHAAEIVDYIEYINFNSMNPKYTIVGLLDNTESYYNHYGFNYKFLGNADTHLIDKEIHYVIGIGNLSFSIIPSGIFTPQIFLKPELYNLAA